MIAFKYSENVVCAGRELTKRGSKKNTRLQSDTANNDAVQAWICMILVTMPRGGWSSVYTHIKLEFNIPQKLQNS
jgi:hypothetical protein